MAQGKALTAEDKKAIVSLKDYFDSTKNDLQELAKPSVKKVANALGFGIATIKRTMADHSRGVDFDELENVFRGRPQRALSDSTQAIVRNYIRNANKEGAYITLEMLCQHLEEVFARTEI